MQHQTYLDEKESQGLSGKVIAIVIVVAAIAALGGYVVYGSGMWNPAPPQQTTNY